MDALDAVLKSSDLVAVLGREVTVQVVNISASGCLLESGNRLAPGATGSLVVRFEGQRLRGRRPDHAVPAVRGSERHVPDRR